MKNVAIWILCIAVFATSGTIWSIEWRVGVCDQLLDIRQEEIYRLEDVVDMQAEVVQSQIDEIDELQTILDNNEICRDRMVSAWHVRELELLAEIKSLRATILPVDPPDGINPPDAPILFQTEEVSYAN